MSASSTALAPRASGFSGNTFRDIRVLTERKSFSQKWGPQIAGLIALFCLAGFVGGFPLSVTLLTIFGFAGMIAGIVEPRLGLLAAGVLSTIDPLTRVYLLSGGLLRWNSFNYILILVMLIRLPVAIRLRDVHSVLLALFTLLLILQLTYTPDIEVGMYNVLNVLAAFGLLLYHLRAGHDRHMFYWLAVINGIAAGLGGAVYFFQIASLPPINKNAWSAFPLTALFSVCIAFPYSRTPRSSMVLGVLGVLNCIWVFFSGSRGGMLIALGCMVFLLCYTKGVQQKLAAVVLAVAAVAIAFASFTNQQEFAFHRVDKLFDTNRALESRTSGRSDLAIAGWYIFRDHPLGVGSGGFGPVYAELIDNDIDFLGHEKGAHSAWVKTLAENGIFGILTLLAYVFSFAWHGWRHRREGLLPLGLLVTFVIASAFFSREFQSKGLWFIAAGYIAISSYHTLSSSPKTAEARDALIRELAGRRVHLTRSAGSTTR